MVTINRPRPSGLSMAKAGVRSASSVTGAAAAGFGIDIEFEPTIAISAARIEKLGMDIRSFKEPLTRAVREVMVQSIAKNFNEGGRPKWPSLSPYTLEIRRRFGHPHDMPLLWTTRLFKVATQINLWTINREIAIVQGMPDKVWYGAIHQVGYGGKEGFGIGRIKRDSGGYDYRATGEGRPVSGIPARPFLLIQPEDRDAIRKVFAKWLDERIDKYMWGKSQGALG